MLSRPTRRFLLAGLLMATRTQLGSAQEVQNAFVVPPDASSVAESPAVLRVHLDFVPAAQTEPAPTPAAPTPKTTDSKTPDIAGPKAPDAGAAPPPGPEAQNFQPITSSALGDTQVALSAPNIMGDFGGYSIRKTIFVPVTLLTTVTQSQTVVTVPSMGPNVTSGALLSSSTTPSRLLVPVAVQVPVVSRAGSGFKIADDDSPTPTDRVFFGYNYFDGLRGQGGIVSSPFASNTITGAPVTTFPSSSTIATITTTNSTTTSSKASPPLSPVPQVDLNREMFGFEKTCLDGYASFEVRVPIYQSMNESIANGGFAGDSFGDVTTVFKFALVKETDRVFSVGLATTFPTGQAIAGDDGSIRAVLFQPFVGFYRGYGDFFVQGFTSLVASTSSQDPTLLFNDYAVGYRVWRGADGSSISPVLEVHVATPLDNHSVDDFSGLYVPDLLSFTGGVHFGMGRYATLSIGCNVPVTGPKPYNAEAIVELNYRF
jgi:hypothetical protein